MHTPEAFKNMNHYSNPSDDENHYSDSGSDYDDHDIVPPPNEDDDVGLDDEDYNNNYVGLDDVVVDNDDVDHDDKDEAGVDQEQDWPTLNLDPIDHGLIYLANQDIDYANTAHILKKRRH